MMNEIFWNQILNLDAFDQSALPLMWHAHYTTAITPQPNWQCGTISIQISKINIINSHKQHLTLNSMF